MKGIILAAGKGTRLYPITLPVCKPLLPVYDKPLIYYSIAILMQAGIRDILIIVPQGETDSFADLFGDGSRLGLNISYKEQIEQKGIADAFVLGRDFVGDDNVCLALGDNILFGSSLRHTLRSTVANFSSGATIFGYYVSDPRPFGVIEFDESGKAVSIAEKPIRPLSNYIVPGLYFYDNSVLDIARVIEPSERGELEITSVNNIFMQAGRMDVELLGNEISWFDAGDADSLYQAAGEIKSAQKSGKYIACLEEIALQNNWITVDRALRAADAMKQTQYGAYLQSVIDDITDII